MLKWTRRVEEISGIGRMKRKEVRPMWSDIQKRPFLKAVAIMFIGFIGLGLLLRWLPG
jgi:hypothetical protein